MSTATGRLCIDLRAIAANWRRVCEQLAQPPAAVIKADAYGLGAEPVGKTLYRAGCREFFLATLDEAISARGFLPSDARLYVLGGARPGEEAEFLRWELVPVLSSLDAVERWARVSQKSSNHKLENPRGSAIKIDTGMTRLGLSDDEWRFLRARPELLRACRPRLWMSHLACADEHDHPMNREQQRRFQNYCDQIRSLFPGIRTSLANSSGIFLGPDWHYDLARTGAALYGYDPHWERDPRMTPVVRLELPVLQLRKLAREADIGYGATESRPAGSWLAVAAGGYADGLNRTLGPKAVGSLAGREVPVVGRISMDTTIFDVTGVELSQPPEQSWISVLDERLTLSRVSRRAGALGYEVLTSLKGRYQRIYLGSEPHV